MKQLVLYHAGCADGFCAAWVAHQVMPDAEFIPVHHGEPPPTIAEGSEVFVLDFSYKRPVLAGIASKAKSVIVLDHHKTAQAELCGVEAKACGGGLEGSPNVFMYFDMGKSGARLTWEHFFPGKPAPWLVTYTEDRDLWRWKLPNSQEINAALRCLPMDFVAWDLLDAASNLQALAVEGAAILRREKQIVTDHVGFAREIEMDGHKVLSVNATVLTSEIAGALAEGRPFGVCWFERSDGRRIYSLRSRDGGQDVSVIARRHGGGGHRNAAGFEV